MPYKNPEDRKACVIRYNKSEKGKATAKRYRKSEKGKEAQRKYEKNNPEKKSAHYYARKIARMICSITECEEIGEKHHPDYSKPLEIVSLCRQHHAEVHNNG
ncbi:hypothetical protein HN682_10015 [Candidatus Peregrinibacteria bacterium]|jgi:hypothetical protein|nr:hypothetical protein [Candidatus Peregrinibacteria bacterium]